MKSKPTPYLEKHRITTGPNRSDSAYGNNGQFIVPGPNKASLFIQASDGEGWEHVSISPYKKTRCPTWGEMCFVKDLFWGKEEVVIQYHPPKSQYINNYQYVLHLWRPENGLIPMPPLPLV